MKAKQMAYPDFKGPLATLTSTALEGAMVTPTSFDRLELVLLVTNLVRFNFGYLHPQCCDNYCNKKATF